MQAPLCSHRKFGVELPVMVEWVAAGGPTQGGLFFLCGGLRLSFLLLLLQPLSLVHFGMSSLGARSCLSTLHSSSNDLPQS